MTDSLPLTPEEEARWRRFSEDHDFVGPEVQRIWSTLDAARNVTPSQPYPRFTGPLPSQPGDLAAALKRAIEAVGPALRGGVWPSDEWIADVAGVMSETVPGSVDLAALREALTYPCPTCHCAWGWHATTPHPTGGDRWCFCEEWPAALSHSNPVPPKHEHTDACFQQLGTEDRTTWSTRYAREHAPVPSTEGLDNRSDSICATCGRKVMRYWSEGVISPWKHWVEPVPDGHAAAPEPQPETPRYPAPLSTDLAGDETSAP